MIVCVGGSEIVTARQDRHARSRSDGAVEHSIGERASGVARYHEVGCENIDVIEGSGDKRDAASQPRPHLNQRVMERRAGGRQPTAFR